MKLQVALNPTTKTVLVEKDGTAVTAGYTKVGTFDHPDLTYPDSTVIYHGVRDVLYQTKMGTPPTTGAKYPNGIYDMQSIKINSADAAIKQEMYFTLQPQSNRVASIGSDIQFSAQVAGGKTPYAPAWWFAAGPSEEFVELDDTDNASVKTLSLINHDISAESAGIYKLVVTDANGLTLESKSYLEIVPETPQSDLPDPVPALTSITATPSTVALSVAADAVNGKTVAFAPVPADADLGTLTIKTAPTAGRATATIAENVLTVKPVAAGADTTVVLTNGTIDVTVNVTVAA